MKGFFGGFMKKAFLRILKDESGQGAVEYVLMLLVVVAIGVLFKTKIKEIFGNQITKFEEKLGVFNDDL